jgi:diadenosine tetraphosphate (Ap4A) HIT family hydrolase
VYRDDQHIAFLPNFHVQRGYVLVAPIEHREGVVADVTLEEHLAAQTLVHAVGRALTQTVATERIYVLSLGSQQGNAHVHWHVVALTPGVPYEQQQLVALTSEHQGVLDFPDDERSQMALELGHRIERELHSAT